MPLAIRIVIALLLVVGSFVLAAITTIALMPVWRWTESTQGIEAVGHSGPAAWCYIVVWAVILGAGLGVYRLRS